MSPERGRDLAQGSMQEVEPEYSPKDTIGEDSFQSCEDFTEENKEMNGRKS